MRSNKIDTLIDLAQHLHLRTQACGEFIIRDENSQALDFKIVLYHHNQFGYIRDLYFGELRKPGP